MDERFQLTREIALCEKCMVELFTPTRTNIAAIGNITPQLHVHIVCRNQEDACWPKTVWNQPLKKYPFEEKISVIQKIRNKILDEASAPVYGQSC